MVGHRRTFPGRCVSRVAGNRPPANPIRRIVMRTNFARALLVLGATFALALVPLQAEASHCSNTGQAGNWAYTYTGTIFTQNRPLPTASVGHFSQDSAGNITGSQTRSAAGNPGVEDIAGNVTVNKDCTATATINVLV